MRHYKAPRKVRHQIVMREVRERLYRKLAPWIAKQTNPFTVKDAGVGCDVSSRKDRGDYAQIDKLLRLMQAKNLLGCASLPGRIRPLFTRSATLTRMFEMRLAILRAVSKKRLGAKSTGAKPPLSKLLVDAVKQLRKQVATLAAASDANARRLEIVERRLRVPPRRHSQPAKPTNGQTDSLSRPATEAEIRALS